MIRPAITISLVPQARGGPFVLWDDLPGSCQVAAELGFEAVELFLPSADFISTEALQKMLDDHQLKLAAVGTGAGWVVHRLSLTAPDAMERQAARQFVRRMIDFAGPFGAPAIIGSMQGRAGDGVSRQDALHHLAEGLDELAEHAGQYNVPLLYEPLNRYETNLCNTIEQSMELLDSLRGRNVKLLADLFHMNIEEADMPAALQRGSMRVGHIHFADSNRRPVGYGHTIIPPIVGALREIGYEGYASAEALPWPDPDRAAARSIESFSFYFRGIPRPGR